MRRISVLDGFWMICAAVQVPGRALEILDKETSSEDGALDLYLNGKKLPRHRIRKQLLLDSIPPGLARIVGHVGFLPAAGLLGWAQPWDAHKFELDEDQARKLIRRKKLKPKQRRGPKALYRTKLIPQVRRSREYQRLETDKERVALIRRKVAELPKQDRTIRLAIQRDPVRN